LGKNFLHPQKFEFIYTWKNETAFLIFSGEKQNMAKLFSVKFSTEKYQLSRKAWNYFTERHLTSVFITIPLLESQ